MIGGVARVAAAGGVFEQHLGDVGDGSGTKPAHDRGGERGPLLEGAEEVEGQRLAGEEIVPQTLGVDDGADLPVSDFPLHQRDQAGVDQVNAALADAGGHHAAEAAGAAVGVEVAATGVAVFLAPQALAEPGGGAKPGVVGFATVVRRNKLGGRSGSGVGGGCIACSVRQTGGLPA